MTTKELLKAVNTTETEYLERLREEQKQRDSARNEVGGGNEAEAEKTG